MCVLHIDLNGKGIGEKMSLFILEDDVNIVCMQHKYIVGNVSIGEYC